ncbi:hypothetical protein A3727_19210 [Erythrobacter sp. HI0038]|nr:hypothetical protein A3727_19210 [Erythrobacter sp. HI0038]
MVSAGTVAGSSQRASAKARVPPEISGAATEKGGLPEGKPPQDSREENCCLKLTPWARCRGIVRRAKLYYLRGRTGKRARIAERRDNAPKA